MDASEACPRRLPATPSIPCINETEAMGESVAITAEDDFSTPQALDSEDWSKTTDIIARRRIQNKLAQRLRRKKLRENGAPNTTLLDPSKEGLSATTPNPLPTTGSGELSTERPEMLKTCQSTPFQTPSKTHNTFFNASDGVPNLPDVSMSGGETATILSRLNETLAQLQEYVSAKPSESHISTSKASLEPTYPSQPYWNPYMMSAFDTNHPGTWSNSLDFPTHVLDNNTNIPAGRRDLTPDMTNNAVSAVLRPTTAPPWLATSKTQPLPESPLSTKPTYLRSASHNTNSTITAVSSTRGSTALHLAAQEGHFETVSLLLRIGGVDIDACDGDGLSALHVAVSHNHTDITRLLLTHGASSTLRTNAGSSILHLAVCHGTLPLVLLVLAYTTVPGDLDLRDQNGKSAFHLAVARGDEEVVRSLLEKGANSMAKVGDQTPVEQVAMSF